jgi:hypothetical protein
MPVEKRKRKKEKRKKAFREVEKKEEKRKKLLGVEGKESTRNGIRNNTDCATSTSWKLHLCIILPSRLRLELHTT